MLTSNTFHPKKRFLNILKIADFMNLGLKNPNWPRWATATKFFSKIFPDLDSTGQMQPDIAIFCVPKPFSVHKFSL